MAFSEAKGVIEVKDFLIFGSVFAVHLEFIDVGGVFFVSIEQTGSG